MCYGLTVLRHSLDSLEANGEFATSRINRRALLFHSGSAVVASTVAATAFGKALHEIGGARSDSARASRDEERALLAICSYAAVGEGDRLAKALYLLEIEARGELDLAEHMQAVLRSTM